MSLPELSKSLHNCQRCKLAKLGRSQVVFGVGNPHATVMFVGEAPGFHEDQQGEPFVGAAGKLLNDLLQSAGLSRSDIYIANVIKCRPPNNRDPEPDEIAQCMPFLARQIDLVHPVRHTVAAQAEGIASESIGLYDLRTGLQVVMMEAAN